MSIRVVDVNARSCDQFLDPCVPRTDTPYFLFAATMDPAEEFYKQFHKQTAGISRGHTVALFHYIAYSTLTN